MAFFWSAQETVYTKVSVRDSDEDANLDAAWLDPLVWGALGLPNGCSSRVAISLCHESDPALRVDCWAVIHAQTKGVALSSHLTELRGSCSASSDWALSLAHPEYLDTVFLKATSRMAYETASSDVERFRAWICAGERILRCGQILRLPDAASVGTSQDTCTYQVISAEPYTFGLCSETTQTFLGFSGASGTDDTAHDVRHAVDENVSSEELEIDEAFLASSALQPLHAVANGLSDDPSGIGSRRVNLEVATMRVKMAVEDDYTIYLAAGDLTRLGLMSGDWALASHISAEERFVRVRLHGEGQQSAAAVSSPVLLHNLMSSHRSTEPPIHVQLRAVPLDMGPPALPVSSAVTLARVASPFTAMRKYDKSLERALRGELRSGRRLVRLGDVIAVPFSHDSLALNDTEDSDEDTPTDGRMPMRSASLYHGVAFYQVTDVECRRTSQSSARGESGAWLDPSSTRLVDAGVKNSFVPDVTSYLRLVGPIVRGDSASDAHKQLSALFAATTVHGTAGLDLNPSILLKGQHGVGKFTACASVTRKLGFHLFDVNCYAVLGESEVHTEAALRVHFDRAMACAPCVLVLRHLEAFASSLATSGTDEPGAIVAALKDCMIASRQAWSTKNFPIIVVGTTADPDKTPGAIISLFKHSVTFPPPGEDERRQVLSRLAEQTVFAADVSITEVATQTAALVAEDLVALLDQCESLAASRLLRDDPPAHSMAGPIPVTMADCSASLSGARAAYSESIGAPKIPNVSWSDVGGLAHVKREVLDTIQLPLDHPELFAGGLKKRSGVLLYGPPGTGKTLVAKAVATSCSLNFFSVKGPELLNMYIGESEANVRRIFQRARDAKPCVIFFDELDSVAPKRGQHGDSGGVMDRIVSQLLAELDGMSSGGSADVFVIGATNRPDLLDPALLRPGRFDRMLYLGLSDTHDAQLQLLQALTRKFKLDPGLDLMRIAKCCPLNLTGADFYALCSDAMLKAMTRKTEVIDRTIEEWNHASNPSSHHPMPMTAQYYLSELASQDEVEVLVSEQDFQDALQELTPSVSEAELQHYESVQSQFSTPQ